MGSLGADMDTNRPEEGVQQAMATSSPAASDLRPDHKMPETWTLTTAPIFQARPPQAHMRVKVVDWCYVNVVTDLVPVPSVPLNGSDSGGGDQHAAQDHPEVQTDVDGDLEPVRREFSRTVDHVLELCRRKYGSSVPGFGVTLQLQATDEGYDVIEETCPKLLASLVNADKLLGDLRRMVSLVPRPRLQVLPGPGLYFPPNTRLVMYKGSKYVAKGPIYPSRASEDFLDAINLLQLREEHPNIVPAPKIFITTSDDDDKVCGFLSPFYPSGTLDVYARRLRAAGSLSEEHLLRWFRQLVGAVAHLTRLGTWHGDLKPDNILVDEKKGDIVLIDFTRIFATFATASPEVRRRCVAHDDGGQLGTGIPPEWPLDRVVRSEVYSIGRTMYLVGEGVSMVELYRKHGWMDPASDFGTTFYEDSLTPAVLRPLILRCVAQDPLQRPGLDELLAFLEGCM